MINVQLTPDYRLTSDGERNFIVEERYTVSPLVNPPADYVYVPRQEWRVVGYYPISRLESAVKYVRNITIAKSDVTTIDGLLSLLRSTTDQLDGSYAPAFHGKIIGD